MSNPNLIKLSLSATHHQNLPMTNAIEIAYGISLPDKLTHWPLGLVSEWNRFALEARDELAACETIGDMARAFLRHRLAERTLIKEAAE